MRYFLASAIVIGLVLPSIGSAQQPPSAESLLALHHSYVGWQLGDASVSSLGLTCVVSDANGTVLQKIAEERAGLLYRNDTDSLRGHHSSGFTGNIFWESNRNGFTTPVIGDTAKLDLAIDALMSEATSTLTATVDGTTQIDGKTYDVLRTTVGPEALDLYIDPTTGAYARAVIASGNATETTIDIDGYIDIGSGRKVIGAFHYDGKPTRETCSDPVLNHPIALDALHPPAPTATWAFTNDQPIPMTITHDAIVIDAIVNGVAGTFILATGADSIMITDGFAAKAHIADLGSGGRAYGIGGSTPIGTGRVNTLTVGGNTLSNVLVDTTRVDFSLPVSPQYPVIQHIDGLLGFDFLAGALIDVNVGAQSIRIRDSQAISPQPSAGPTFAVDLQNGTPVVPMMINGRIPVLATLDSGTDASVYFATDLIMHHGLAIAYDTTNAAAITSSAVVYGAGGIDTSGVTSSSSATVYGVGGLTALECGHLDSLSLGPIVYQEMPACETRDLSDRDIIVGWDFIKHFNLEFDYPRSLLQLIPIGS